MDRSELRSTAGELLAMGFAMDAAADAFQGRTCDFMIDREYVPAVLNVGKRMGVSIMSYDDGTGLVQVEFSRKR